MKTGEKQTPTPEKPQLFLKHENSYGNPVYAVHARIGKKPLETFRMFGSLSQELPDYIIKAVNTHEELMEAAKEALAILQNNGILAGQEALIRSIQKAEGTL